MPPTAKGMKKSSPTQKLNRALPGCTPSSASAGRRMSGSAVVS